MPSAVIIANPQAGPQRSRLTGDQAVRRLNDRGLSADWWATQGPGQATELAQRAVAEGVELVIALGGDGTVHEVAAGLVGTRATLGVLPGGSGNDFARAAGCRLQSRALAAMVRGRDLVVDTATLDGEFFINSLGLLASGLVSLRAAGFWRWLGGWRYRLASASTLLSFSGQQIAWRFFRGAELVGEQQGSYLLAEVCNSRYTGGGFVFAPEARLDSGQLVAFLVRQVPPWTSLRLLPGAATGRPLRHPAISRWPVTRLEFTVQKKVAYHRDGEAGFLAAGSHEVLLNQGTLKVRVPAQGLGNHEAGGA